MVITMGEQCKLKLNILLGPDVTLWMKNEDCELDYEVPQYLTSHGCFRKYLHRFVHDTSLICPNRVDDEEDAEHYLRYCPSLDGPERRVLDQSG